MIDNKVAQLDAIKEFLYEVCEIFKVYCTEIIEASKDKDDSSKESLLDSIDDDNSQDVESSVGDEEEMAGHNNFRRLNAVNKRIKDGVIEGFGAVGNVGAMVGGKMIKNF